ncbi:MAG: Flp family type IVb pilin [Rhodospirillaceae bacterium]|nr:MAG: Flp family type IVb pilin [Rhodospirillaceae bacterium]
MLKLVRKFKKEKSGVTAIEYGLIAALIAVAIITAVGTIGSDLKAKFEEIATKLGGGAGTEAPPSDPG